MGRYHFFMSSFLFDGFVHFKSEESFRIAEKLIPPIRGFQISPSKEPLVLFFQYEDKAITQEFVKKFYTLAVGENEIEQVILLPSKGGGRLTIHTMESIRRRVHEKTKKTDELIQTLRARSLSKNAIESARSKPKEEEDESESARRKS